MISAAGAVYDARFMTYRRAEHTAWRDLGDETVVVDLTANEMYGLNPTAGYLWQALDGTVALAVLADRLDSVALDQIESFCAEMVQLKLLEEAKPAPRAVAETETVPPSPADPPALLWHESIRQAAATCAFLPAQNPLCTVAPFS